MDVRLRSPQEQIAELCICDSTMGASVLWPICLDHYIFTSGNIVDLL
jgi:hypothetical protein